MKTIIYACAALAFGGLCACSNGGNTAISDFVIKENIKSASQTYMEISDNDTIYWTLSTSVQWPVEFGDHSLEVLQDSIMQKLFGGATLQNKMKIDDAIAHFIDTPDIFEENATMVKVDSIPELVMNSRYIEETAKVAELNEKFVTYQIIHSSYLGGAHPNTGIDMFTYDLEQGQVMTMANMFKPGTEKALMTAIREALAQQLGVDSPDKLEDAGIFTDQLTEPGQPYLQDDALVIYYNPYEIAPYAMGPIEVTLWPEAVETLVTPRVIELMSNK